MNLSPGAPDMMSDPGPQEGGRPRSLAAFPAFVGLSGDSGAPWQLFPSPDGTGLLRSDRRDGTGVYLNLCRHRGFPIVDDGADCPARLVCPYHGWRYDRDGRVLGEAWERATDTVGERPGLVRARLTELGACRFGSVSGGSLAPGLAAELDAWFGLLAPDAMRRMAVRRYFVRSDWTCWVENFLECYHCAGNHPELSQVEGHIPAAAANDIPTMAAIYERARAAARRLGMAPPERVLMEPDHPVPGFVDISCLSARGFATRDARAAGPSILAAGTHSDLFVYGAVGPFCHFTIYSDYFFIKSVSLGGQPSGRPGVTVTCHWYAHESLDPERHAGNIVWLWDNTIRQDIRLVERLHRGRATGHAAEPIFIDHEYQSGRFHRWLTDGEGAELARR